MFHVLSRGSTRFGIRLDQIDSLVDKDIHIDSIYYIIVQTIIYLIY